MDVSPFENHFQNLCLIPDSCLWTSSSQIFQCHHIGSVTRFAVFVVRILSCHAFNGDNDPVSSAPINSFEHVFFIAHDGSLISTVQNIRCIVFIVGGRRDRMPNIVFFLSVPAKVGESFYV